jgi:nucleotide-binding universal stress UspA family protein
MTGSGDDGQARIVVGIDGSECSKEALRWAVRQAKLTGATLDAVIGWHYPVFYGWAPGPQDFDFGGAAEQAVTEALDEVLGADRPAWLRTRVVEGHAAQVLVDATAGAELLIVGSRGHGGIVDALLGSVSTYCVRHAQCPVTVIRSVGHAAQSSAPGPGGAGRRGRS